MSRDLDPKDPTQSLHIEDEYAAALSKLFGNLQKKLEEFLITDTHTQSTPASQMPFDITRFMKYLEVSIEEEIISPGREISSTYATASYKHGVLYAKAQMDMEVVLRKGDWDPKVLDIIEARNFSELKGVSEEVSKQITRVITEGMLRGDNPRDIARSMRDATDFGKTRSEAIARSEVMKAVNTGTIDRSEKQGYNTVERIETIDERTCTDWEFEIDGEKYYGCAEIDGVIFTMDQARQVTAQQHPNCRGCFAPHMTDEEAAAMDAEG